MFDRLVKEEEGMTMALTVIMIVLIGVMGAGLLTFVQRDLESVVEVNRGQSAFEMADAGVQAARQQIRRDGDPEHYDIDNTANAAYYSGVCNDAGDDSTQQSPRLPATDDWSPEAGVTRDVPGTGKFTVQIRWMSRVSAADQRCRAPVVAGFEPGKAQFFRVTSEGEFSGAKRKVEAVVSTFDLGVPRAYFTPSNISVNGSSCIKGVSLFSLQDITFNGGGECTLPDGSKTHMSGTDFAYGNWNTSGFNTTPRPTTDAGVGAVGTVNQKVSGRDFDTSSNPTRFVKYLDPPSPQPTSEITFPFNYNYAIPGTTEDNERLAFYKAEAELQGNYKEIAGNGNESLSTWPTNSSYDTVYYVKFTGASPGTLTWDVPGDCSAASRKKGILIVENGGFTTSPNQALFSGTIIVRGGVVSDGAYSDSGNTCIEGFANASGEIKVSGSTNPSSTPNLANTLGFYGVRLWSYRECYSVSCN